MKLAKLMLNCLLFVITFAIVLGMQYGITALFTLQAQPDAERVKFLPEENETGYLDSITFMKNDISAGWENEDPFWVRSWFGAPDWWVSGMGWLDWTLGKITVFGKTLVTPVLSINHLRNYEIPNYDEAWESWKIEAVGVDENGETIFVHNWENYLRSEAYLNTIDMNSPAQKGAYEGALADLLYKTQNQWKNDHPDEYKFIRLAMHYNDARLELYRGKFIDNGSVKFEAITVYIHVFTSLAIAAWFVHNNKFTLSRNEETDENEVHGGYRGLPGFGKRKKKKRKHSKE